MTGYAADALLFLGVLVITGIAAVGVGARWPRLLDHLR
jgi:hypothetical protein